MALTNVAWLAKFWNVQNRVIIYAFLFGWQGKKNSKVKNTK